MYNPGKGVGSTLAVASVAVLAASFYWIGYPSSHAVARDYEECAIEAKANTASTAEYSREIEACSARFAGRRKLGGGYSYFDFMQNRSFDIAGPNPTADERKQIDLSYMEFLRAQRQEILSSDFAKAKADREQGALEAEKTVGAPLALTPKVPLPVKRPVVERSKICEAGSLACGWAKLSAAVRSAFASSNTNR